MKKIYYLIAMAVTAFTFTSCEDVPEPFGQPINPNPVEEETIAPEGDGSVATPFNGVGVYEFTKSLGADQTSETAVYMKGYVTDPPSYSKAKYDISTEYKNATFGIADTKDGKASFLIYRSKGLDNADVTDADFIKKGDFVVVCGKVVNYAGNTPETVQNATYIVSINSEGGGDTPTPPSGDAKAVSVADFLAAAVSTDVWYQLTGTIKNLKDGDQYGNFDIEDATGSVYVYGLLAEKGGEKKKFQELVAAKGIANGKKITIIGNRADFKGTAQVGNAYFVKIEDGEGGGDTPPTPSGDNLLANGDFESWTDNAPDNWNGAAGNATLEKSTDVHGGNAAVLIKTNSANKRLSYKAMTLKKGTYNITFYAKAAAGTAKIAPGYVAIVNGAPDSQNYKYPETYPEVGTEWTAVNHSFTLDADTELCLVIMKHKSTANDVIIDDYVLSTTDGGVAGGGEGGGDTPTSSGDAQAVSVANFLAAAVSTDVWYQLTGTISNLKDGDKYGNFDLTDETGSVYVYGLLSEKGGAKQKFQDLVTAKGIANGKKITIIGNRADFKGTAQVGNAYFVSIE